VGWDPSAASGFSKVVVLLPYQRRHADPAKTIMMTIAKRMLKQDFIIWRDDIEKEAVGREYPW